MIRRPRGKPQPANTTISIPVSSLSTGAQSANSFTGWTSPATSTVVNDTRWGTTGKHLLSGSSTTFMAKSTGTSRDQEVSLWGQQVNVYLRLTDSGKAIVFRVSPLFATLGVSVCTGITEGLAPGNNNYAVGFGAQLTNTWIVPIPAITSAPGYSSSSNTGHYWTFGCEAFDVYIKYNGVEVWRSKQFWHLEPGRIAIAATSGTGFRDVTAIHKISATTYSDIGAKVFDIRDFGMKSLSAVGSMTAGSYDLLLDDSNPGFAVGDKICIATGGEPGGGIPGERGVGGQWPSLMYATNAARDSDTTQATNKVCGVLATGNTSEWNGTAWVPYYWNVVPYLTKIVPKALVATITNVSGTTITLDTAATAATTSANVYFDNAALMAASFTANFNGLPQQSDCTISFPSGTWVFANSRPSISSVNGLKVLGAGIDETIILSPTGASETGFYISSCAAPYIAGFTFVGNTRSDKGYFFQFDPTTDVWTGATSFVRVTSCSAARTEYIKGVNYSQAVSEFSYCNDSAQRFIQVIHETGHKVYFQWAVNIADSTNCLSEDIYFDSPWLFKGLESFRSNGSILRRATGRNVIFSSNSNANLTIEECSIVYELGCGDSPSNVGQPLGVIQPDPREPLVNINSNIDNTSGSASGSGITIRNCDFNVQGRIWTGYGVSVIAVAATVPQVNVIGKYPTKPVSSPSGQFTLPNLGSDASQALSCDSGVPLVVIDGARVVHSATRSAFGNQFGVPQAGMTIRNSVLDNQTAGGTQSNNITNAAYEAL